MTTSGTVSFSVTRDNLIEAALKHISALGDGETPSATQVTEASLLLNMLVKSKMADGMPLWALKTGYILPFTGSSSVSVGPAGGAATNSYTVTTTSAAASSGASTIIVTSATGFANAFYIGIELTDSTIQWTTINGVPSGTTITLTAALTGDVALGAQVYAYQTKMQRPLRVIDAYLKNIVSNTEHKINIVPYTDYNALGNHTDASIPNQVYYDPQLDNGTFFVYPRFLTGDYLIQIRYHRPFEDFNAASDTPDFPQEFYLPLMVSLASLLAPKNGVPLDERKTLAMEAIGIWAQALSNGTEEGSVYMQPNRIR